MSEPRKALITGITGQDGSYLAELLLEKGYEVHGLIRRSSSFNTGRIDHLYRDPHEAQTRLFLHYADLTDSSSLIGHLHRVKPDEVYNLGAQSHVKVSFEMPEFTAETAAMGTLRMLEAVRTADWPIRFYQAGSSEMFGKVVERPQTERTPFYPRSPYAVAKVFAHFMTVDYREAYGLHASNGILFNHESPRRGGTFVTRKVTRGVAAILAGKQEHLFLGNLDAKRDWGYAKEYVEAMWLMLQQPEPDDYVIATGETHSVRELCEVAFGLVGLDWERYVRVDEVPPAHRGGRALRGRLEGGERLGWEARTTFRDLVRLMLEHDLREAGLDPSTARGGDPVTDFWPGRRVMVTGGGGFLGRAVVRRLEAGGATRSSSPLAGLRPPDEGRDRPRAGRWPPGPGHPPGGGRGRDRGEPGEPGPLLLRERDHGHPAHGAGAPRRRGQVRHDRDRLRLPEVHAGAVPRGRSLERLPGGDERAIRPGQEDAPGAGPGLPPAVRLQRHPPDPGQPLRARATTSTRPAPTSSRP